MYKLRPFFALLVAVLASGCGGGYNSKTSAAHQDFYSGQCAEAAKKLEENAHKDGKDQLLYLFDRSSALFCAEDYGNAIREFLLADKMAEIKDYTSISTEVATLLTSDEIKHYKAEEFEYVLISQYLAMAYLFQGKYEDALVECRRVNHKLHMLVSQGGRHYKQNPMALYLSALIYEDQGEFSDAYIDYQNVFELSPDFSFLKEDLIRTAIRSKNSQDLDKWREIFKLNSDDVKKIKNDANLPEVVFLIQNGRAPEKRPDPGWSSIPRFYPKSNSYTNLKISVSGENEFSNGTKSESLYDVERVAMQNLEEKWGPLIAKKIAGVIAKDVIADQIGKRTDPAIGFLLWIGMHASDQADTRSWQTLPKDFQIARLRLPGPGTYKISWQGVGYSSGTSVEKQIIISESENKKIKRVFLPVQI